MAHHGHAQTVRNPGPYQVSSSLKMIFVAFVVIGVAAFGFTLMKDPQRAWSSFVLNQFYFMSLGLGGLFFASIMWLTGAMWSAPFRRVAEAFTAYLPFALLTFVVLYFGLHDLYIWTHEDHVKGDLILEGKAGYLSVGFFMVRNLIAFAIWIFFAKKMIGNSLNQDRDGHLIHTARNQVLAPVFLILFAITYTMNSFDVLMSLDPHWFSTMFGVYCFAGLFYSVLALICIVTVTLKRKGALEGIVNENHLHDLGKFMFAFTVFWAYIGFSQFMLIWYANLPEETGYFLNRFQGQWLYVTIFLLVGKFMVPFFVLLPRAAKRSWGHLYRVAWFMLVAQWIDFLWLVQPQFYPEGPRVGLAEIGVTLGFAGVFGLLVARFMSKNNIVAIGDPRLAEAVHHHHV